VTGVLSVVEKGTGGLTVPILWVEVDVRTREGCMASDRRHCGSDQQLAPACMLDRGHTFERVSLLKALAHPFGARQAVSHRKLEAPAGGQARQAG